MEEVRVKTHLIITDIHEEYQIKWYGKIAQMKPKFKNNKLLFAIVGGKGRVELNTNDMKEIEERAKRLTYPRGRTAVTKDNAYVYLIEEDNSEQKIGTVTHYKIKTYAPMYDKVGYRY